MKDMMYCDDYIVPESGDWFDLSALPASSFLPHQINESASFSNPSSERQPAASESSSPRTA